MLGRNAARPFGMTPSRLVAAYSTAASHRVAHWILSKPYAMVHMQRYLLNSANHFLTSAPTSPSGIVTSTLVSLDSCSLHTSAASPAPSSPSLPALDPSPSSSTYSPAVSPATAAQTAAVPFPDELYYPFPGENKGYLNSGPEDIAAVSKDAATVQSVASKNAVAFNYLLAASWHPKSRSRAKEQPQPQTPLGSAFNNSEKGLGNGHTLRFADMRDRPFPGKVDAGEDAFFHISTPSRVALGVADGVGGWSELGVDPALFSWALMNNAENVARLTDTVSPEEQQAATATAADNASGPVVQKVLDAQTILDGAYSELVNSGKIEAGSSTACILSLCKSTGTLRASNLGDSSFLLIRDNQCIYESPSQQHFWNCPYQLTILPPKERQQAGAESTGGSGGSDQESVSADKKSNRSTGPTRRKKYVQDFPTDAVQTSHQLQDGDVIVLATDGFWDNVFTKEALELVDRELGDIVRESHQDIEITSNELMAKVQALSKRLTNTARRFSTDTTRLTPFSQGARHLRTGGKVDDITVIVTLVREVV